MTRKTSSAASENMLCFGHGFDPAAAPPDRADARQGGRSAAERATSCSSRSGTASAPSSFATHGELSIQSRDLQAARPLLPRAARHVPRAAAGGCVVDGEIVVATPRGLDFDALAAAPAPGRVARRQLASETPASFVAFDLLARRRPRTDAARRRPSGALLLEALLATPKPPLHLTPMTRDRALAAAVAAAVRGRRARRRDRQADGRAPTCRANARC